MKRILFACLIGMASLLPSNKISAATPSAAASRIIDCYVEGIVLIATSDESTGTLVSITFDPETENAIELQREGWQAILNNFKSYTESR